MVDERGAIVWFTGLPSSGKSTLARRVRDRLRRRALLLDGDELRMALAPRPGYTAEARDAFYATLGNVALLAARQGFTVLVAATAHRRAYRDAVRHAGPRFIEVLLSVPLDEAMRRDAGKGLYERVQGSTTDSSLPGVGVEYEPPVSPDVTATGGHDDSAVDRICALLEPDG